MGMNRELILINGGPCSGRSCLGENLAQQLHTEMSVEHLSVSKVLHAIGRGALKSYYSHDIHTHFKSRPGQQIEDFIMYTVVEEMLERANGTELILLNEFPANREQVKDLVELATFDNRTITGLLHTEVEDSLAIFRMINRPPRSYQSQFTVSSAEERLKQRTMDFKAAALELSSLDIPFELIDTSESEDISTRHGFLAVHQFLDISEERRRADM